MIGVVLMWVELIYSSFHTKPQITYLPLFFSTAKQALYCFNRSSCDKSSLYSKLPGCRCVFYHCTLFFFVTAHYDCTFFCRYSLEWHVDSDSCFDIDTVEGTISTNDYLDRETALQHNITVLATKVSKYPARKTSLEKGLLSSYLTHSDYMFK